MRALAMARLTAAVSRWSSSELRANRYVVAVSAMPPSRAVTAKNSVTRVLRRSGRRRAMVVSVARRRARGSTGSDTAGAHAAAAGEAPGGGRHLTGAA